MQKFLRLSLCVYGTLACLSVAGSTAPALAAPKQEQVQDLTNNPAMYRKVSGFDAEITAVDVARGAIRFRWSGDTPLLPHEILVTVATRFMREEKGLYVSDVAVGDVLVEINSSNVGPHHESAHLAAQGLDVISVHPLTVNIRGASSWSSPDLKPRPGQSPAQAMLRSLDEDEVSGLGVFVPHRRWQDLTTGKWQTSTRFVIAESKNILCTRSVSDPTLTLSDFRVGQRISFDASPHVGGKFNADNLWLVVAPSTHSKD